MAALLLMALLWSLVMSGCGSNAAAAVMLRERGSRRASPRQAAQAAYNMDYTVRLWPDSTFCALC